MYSEKLNPEDAETITVPTASVVKDAANDKDLISTPERNVWHVMTREDTSTDKLLFRTWHAAGGHTNVVYIAFVVDGEIA